MNRCNTDKWKEDCWHSVDEYNSWFINFAPKAFRKARRGVIERVGDTLSKLDFLKKGTVEMLLAHPEVVGVLRACTAPPLAIDRVAGLCGVTNSFVRTLEAGKLPKRTKEDALRGKMAELAGLFQKMIDLDLFPWLSTQSMPSKSVIERSASIVADRISVSSADPIIRNAQEQRQLSVIQSYLYSKSYTFIESGKIKDFREMRAGTFTFHLIVPVKNGEQPVRMPIDVVIMPHDIPQSGLPVLVECKSAGDFANTNKRRKEEAVKITQLRETYGKKVAFVLFLCGYFGPSYLGYEASEGIDWVWEHRVTDFAEIGI